MTGFAVLPSAIARDGSIEPPLKAILLVLSSYAGADQTCWPSVKTITEAVGLQDRSVREWLREAIRRGLVTSTPRASADGGTTSNLYRLNFAKWGEVAAWQNLPTPLANNANPPLQPSAYPPAPECIPPCTTVPPNNTSDQDQGTKPQEPPPASAPQAEPVAPKVKKEKPKGPPRSHRAGDEIAAWWNGSLALLGNAPCSGDRAWLVKYGKVAEAAAQAVGCLETIGLMMRWAYESDNYHAGRMAKGQRRTWRLEQWLAREHFEEMHAECVRARYLDDPFIDWSNRTIKELDHEASNPAEQDPVAKAAA